VALRRLQEPAEWSKLDGMHSASTAPEMPATSSAAPALDRIAVVVPAWQPERVLLELLDALSAAGAAAIILVDDGSSPACEEIFAAAANLPCVHLLRHPLNRGKGRALKTGFAYVLERFHSLDGVVTADADGQHRPADIVRVAKAIDRPHPRMVLGARRFGSGAPLRSRLGNALTRHLFAWTANIRLMDTQTGLRAFPLSMLPALLAVEGERYEYEMHVLVRLCSSNATPEHPSLQPLPMEVPVEAVYIAGNRSSHFHPVRDSMRIYLVLLRSWASGLLAAEGPLRRLFDCTQDDR
jgi:glycosyltransferase involved in cell wall biosynthesis